MHPADDTATSEPSQTKSQGTGIRFEAAGIIALIAVAVYYLVVSWRRWNHPLIDFGPQLYTPWRLSEGAVLYRDVDDLYGPLSQYFNAGLFKVFGPGLMVLVTANLVVFTAIAGMSYVLFRRAWGIAGAMAACLVFISVFAFSQFYVVSNFNYATPYAHEATHGMLVSLALIAVLAAWCDRPTVALSFAAGLLCGCTLLLKPEYILAAAVVSVAALALRWQRREPITARHLGVASIGLLLPTIGFAVLFSFSLPWLESIQAASRAWLSVLIRSDILSKPYQLSFSGLDHPWANLREHLLKTVQVIAVVGALGGGVAFALRRQAALQLCLILVIIVVAAMMGWRTEWGDIGQCFVGINVIYLVWCWTRWLPGKGRIPCTDQATHTRRVLLATFATAMMVRMILNGRIVQFGFFQAALAGMVLVAILGSESAEWMPSLPGRRLSVVAVLGALVVPGIIICSMASHRFLQSQTAPIAEGRDRFYWYPKEVETTGHLVASVLGVLRTAPPNSTLLALPEGHIINYLARMRSPLPQFQFYSFTTEDGRERSVVEALEAHPPDFIVFISRDLHDFGITRYGDRDGEGRQIVQWAEKNYRITHHFGDDPLSSDQRGAYILQRRSSELLIK